MTPPPHIIDFGDSSALIDSPYPRIFLILTSLIAWLILIPALTLQIKAKNLPIAVLIACSMITYFMLFIGSIVWPTNTFPDWWNGRGFCDIGVFLNTFSSQAIAGGAVCLFRQLSKVLDPDYAARTISRKEKLWTKIFERTLCLGLPFVRSCLFYLIAPMRYFIFGLHGCAPVIDTSWPSIPLYHMWFLIAIALCVFYAIQVLYMLSMHRMDMREIISRTNDRTRRLTVFACFLLCVYVPFAVYLNYKLIPTYFIPFDWASIHPDDWEDRIFAVQIYDLFVIEDFCRNVFGIVLFACFGVGKDAREQYREIGEKLGFTWRRFWRAMGNCCIHSW